MFLGTNSHLGIGRASALQFAQNGAKAIYLCDYDAEFLDVHKHEITSLYPGTDVHTRCFDAADETEVKNVVDDAVRRYGRLDVFFANAGTIGPHAPFTDIDGSEFMQTLRVNALG